MRTDALLLLVAALVGAGTGAAWRLAQRPAGGDITLSAAAPAQTRGPRPAGATAAAQPATSARPEALHQALAQTPEYQRRLASWPLILTAKAAELADLVEQLKHHHGEDADTLRLVVHRLTALDPDRALAFAAAREGDFGLDEPVVHAVLETLAETEPERVPRWLDSLPAGRRALFHRAWVQSLTPVDPAAAMDWLARHPEAGPSSLEWLAGDLARQSPELALAKAQALPRPELRRTALRGALLAWATADPAAALAWLKTQPELAGRESYRRAMLHAIATEDPARAAELLLGVASDALSDPRGVQYILDPWIERDPRAARAWLERLPPSQSARLQDRLLEAWVREDGPGAMAYALGRPELEEARDAASAAAHAWRKRDAAGFADWLRAQSPGVMRTTALQSVLRGGEEPGLVETRANLELLRSLPGRLARAEQDLLRQEVNHLATLDLEGALAWAREEKNPQLRNKLVGAALSGGAANDPARVGEILLQLVDSAEGAVLPESFHSMRLLTAWVAKDAPAAARWTALLGDEQLRHRLRSELAQAWSERDPAAAQAWVLTIASASSRDEYLRIIYQNWARTHPAAALEAAQLLPTSARQLAVPQVIRGYADEQPVVAARLAEQLPDETDRPSVFREVAERWLQIDPPAARAWIQRQRSKFHPDDLPSLLVR